MTTKFLFTLMTAFLLSLTSGAFSQEDHGHEHGHEHGDIAGFASLDDGWIALEEVSDNIRTAVTANDMEALHALADELRGVADGLGKQDSDVPQANQLRFTSSVNQLRTLSDRLHTAYEQGDSAAAQQMVPQLNGVMQLLMASAETN